MCSCEEGGHDGQNGNEIRNRNNNGEWSSQGSKIECLLRPPVIQSFREDSA